MEMLASNYVRSSLTAVFLGGKILSIWRHDVKRKIVLKVILPCGRHHGCLLRQRGLNWRRSRQHVEALLVGDILDLTPLPVRIQVRVRALNDHRTPCVITFLM